MWRIWENYAQLKMEVVFTESCRITMKHAMEAISKDWQIRMAAKFFCLVSAEE